MAVELLFVVRLHVVDFNLVVIPHQSKHKGSPILLHIIGLRWARRAMNQKERNRCEAILVDTRDGEAIQDCRLPIADCQLPIADWGAPVSDFPPSSKRQMEIGNRQSPPIDNFIVGYDDPGQTGAWHNAAWR